LCQRAAMFCVKRLLLAAALARALATSLASHSKSDRVGSKFMIATTPRYSAQNSASAWRRWPRTSRRSRPRTARAHSGAGHGLPGDLERHRHRRPRQEAHAPAPRCGEDEDLAAGFDAIEQDQELRHDRDGAGVALSRASEFGRFEARYSLGPRMP
jgi:hypothetical protein